MKILIYLAINIGELLSKLINVCISLLVLWDNVHQLALIEIALHHLKVLF